MKPIFPILALLLLPIAPVAAQDLLGPLQDFVEELTEPAATERAPRRIVPVTEAATPPPVPRPRPPSLPDVPVVDAPAAVAEEPAVELAPEPEAEPEPEPEPERVFQAACPAVINGLVVAEMAPPLSEKACGERSPLVVTAVRSGGRMVPLSTPVTTNCQMASALPRWVETVDGYSTAMLGAKLATINTGTSYQCRARVGGSVDTTSEHGFANAVDVVGFTLEDGQTIGVEADWAKATAPEGRLLRLAHDAACADFTTVLGPEANAAHGDHLHLDLGCHGQSCTAQICE